MAATTRFVTHLHQCRIVHGMPEVHDIAVIGGGPAGAHAAFKAALLFQTCALFDRGRRFSRIYFSPQVDNLPGRYGQSGREIVANGYDIIRAYELDHGHFVDVHEDTTVTQVDRDADGLFVIHASGRQGDVTVKAKALILATGAIDRQPRMRDFRKRDIEAILPYANKGLADYCLLCDGHTVKDKRVAVLGCGPSAASVAASLKANFGAKTAVVAACELGHPDDPGHSDADWQDIRARLGRRDIPVLRGEIKEFTGIKDGRFGIVFADGSTESFDKAWISMGWYRVNNEHAVALGAKTDDGGFVVTDHDSRVLDAEGVVIAGLYAIGDLRADSWKQIPIAWGQAEAAAIDAFVGQG